MGLELPPEESNRCVRGCCRSAAIPLHLPPASYSLVSPVARGSESTVYEARLGGERAAAKKPVLSTSEDLDKFHYQLQLLCKLDHPGLAKLIAAHAKPPNYLLFFDFFDPPNLADKIHVEEWSPSVQQVVSIANDLANALRYLHILGVVHRDIKPANILLDKDLHPRLADFGLAMFQKDIKRISVENWKSSGKPTGGFHKKNMVGTLIYMAPEILRKDIHTEKSDVYSYGISINELLTGVVPYTDLRAEAQAHTVLEMTYTEQQLTAAVVAQGLRPALALPESGAPPNLLSLIQRCWDPRPEQRPSFKDIIEELNIIQNHLGSAAAEFSVRAVPGLLKQLGPDTSPTDALAEAFVRTDIAFREELIVHQKSKRITKKDWHPGCTAVTALIVRNKLFVANAGDCRAILNRAGKPLPMTRVTRSIGDDDLKPAVTAQPEIIETALSAEDEFLVDPFSL
ncbi:hypothetical protein PR202_gb05882 [Eleusine coracana subsp. coracana]|uniref:protein-serine/threonine phosphatase n=1 Tax=Eleusine coracana subsp. coracana TaxID=191504 RepID=A0AAV5E858_ELECO|nr:hypothetical protein PR202_gb05882 [Eleusine coracana subsp. coracana]